MSAEPPARHEDNDFLDFFGVGAAHQEEERNVGREAEDDAHPRRSAFSRARFSLP
jgi:hypothetical protein